MLKIVQPQGSPHPTKPSTPLNLPADYEFQVAAHLTLVDLQSYIQDLVRFLRTLDRSTEVETESWPKSVILCFWLMSKRYGIYWSVKALFIFVFAFHIYIFINRTELDYLFSQVKTKEMLTQLTNAL